MSMDERIVQSNENAVWSRQARYRSDVGSRSQPFADWLQPEPSLVLFSKTCPFLSSFTSQTSERLTLKLHSTGDIQQETAANRLNYHVPTHSLDPPRHHPGRAWKLLTSSATLRLARTQLSSMPTVFGFSIG